MAHQSNYTDLLFKNIDSLDSIILENGTILFEIIYMGCHECRICPFKHRGSCFVEKNINKEYDEILKYFQTHLPERLI